MKKIRLLLAALVVTALTFQGCEDMDDKAVPVNDFIWKGLNLYYLWQPDVPDLADDKFENQAQLNTYLEGFSSPEALFHHLLYKPGEVDRFSVIFSDYHVLENALQGVVKSNGVEFGLVYTDASQYNIFGYVRYILPGSDASGKDIQRGDIFYAIDGTPLNADNYQDLLSRDSYVLNLAAYNDGAITPTNESVTLTKTEYAENPVYTTNVIEVDGHKIGYFMYNGFFSSYDDELNAAIGQLAAQGIEELVLDLRYNSGGSVRTATYLGSMLTGQFNGMLFAKEQWNPKLQAYFESENPAALEDRFTDQLSNGTSINHLNLSRVYILTTRSTASASELVINGLKSYIDVIQIGDFTIGKNVGSVTLYDSPDFSKKDVSGAHTYAMQPLVLKIENADGFGDYTNGLEPDLLLKENFGNMGVLGDPEEPLFEAAINMITGNGRFGFFPENQDYKQFKDSKSMRRFGTEMYKEDMPSGALNLLKNL